MYKVLNINLQRKDKFLIETSHHSIKFIDPFLHISSLFICRNLKAQRSLIIQVFLFVRQDQGAILQIMSAWVALFDNLI
jgi:hypothetical protein